MYKVAQALVNDLGYTRAFRSTDVYGEAKFAPIMNSNLAADLPVLLEISRPGGAHAVVCDGFGYDGGVMYHHINMGWAGSQDAWYDIPDMYTYNTLVSVTYNVFTNQTGELVAGRVVNALGQPLSGATVTATPPGGGLTLTASTDALGYYGIVGASCATYYNVQAYLAGYAVSNRTGVITGTSSGNVCGNCWGIDFTLAGSAPLSLTACPLQTSIVLRWSEPVLSGMPSNHVYVRRGTTGYPQTSGEGALVYSGTAQSCENSGLTTGQPYYYTIWGNNGTPYAPFPTGSVVNATGTPQAGSLKLYWHSTQGSLGLWHLSATGSIKQAVAIFPSPVLGWTVHAVGDINADGNPDLIWRRNSDGAVAYWLLASDGVMTSNGMLVDMDLRGWTLAASAYINGDNVVDLVWRRNSDGALAYWFLNANGTLGATGMIYDGNLLGWTVAGVGRINADSVDDIVWRRNSDGALACWFLNSNGTIGSAVMMYDGNLLGWTIAGLGYVNADSVLDIVWRRNSDGAPACWFLNANGTIGSTAMIYDGNLLGWTIAGVGRINADSVDDLIWRRDSDGAVAYWLLNANGSLASNGLTLGENLLSWSLRGVK